MELIPLCIVGTPPRAQLYARALRRLCRLRSSAAAASASAAAELRVTCICSTDLAARTALCAVLQQDDSVAGGDPAAVDALEEHGDLDDVFVLEEFGDFVCSAVLVLLDDVECRVTTAAHALRKGKHVLLEPWAPALTTARRWRGVDDALRRLWECVRAEDSRCICELSHPVGAAARRFDAWLRANGAGRTVSASALVLRPFRPDVIASAAVGTTHPEHTAWIRALRHWLTADAEEPLAFGVTLGPGSGACSLTPPGAVAGAVIVWPEIVDEEAEQASRLASMLARGHSSSDALGNLALHCRYCITALSSTATLVMRFYQDGCAGDAEGSLLVDGDEAFGGSARRFACSEVDTLGDELTRFAARVSALQTELISGGAAPAEVVSAALALDVADRATYAGLLEALDVPAAA
eukprot:NODE_552_length_2939_cov_3.334637.p1 GENE.NODE_552_length_2939_cov_3.334637~~NODE_552_length_2939_cov_3.334637.p1  ORF type:complete len:410 (+),score=132.20 NODE_552_length_2939_cov_3.334637:129-1358(+)